MNNTMNQSPIKPATSSTNQNVPISLTILINTLIIIIFTCPMWITAWLEYDDARDHNQFIQSISAAETSGATQTSDGNE